MSTFFQQCPKKIKENESEVKVINNFLTEDECNNFIEYFNNLKEIIIKSVC